MDILNLQPTTISRDLKGKYVCIYSKPKLGKTTMASQFPNNLLVAFEIGYNALGGIYAAPVNRWIEFKQIITQLEKPEARDRYKTISIDTVSIAWEKCEVYICQQNNVEALGDIPWGKGYDLCKKEFANALRRISMAGYGLVFIAHEEIKKIKKVSTSDHLLPFAGGAVIEVVEETGETIEVISPAMPKRAYDIVNQMVDIIGYIAEKEENGKMVRVMYTRGTPTLIAGSRFKYMVPIIPFGYEELVKALNDAIEKSQKLDGINLTNDKVSNFTEEERRPFEETMEEAKRCWQNAMDINSEGMGPKLSLIVETYFGQPIKLSTATERQQDLVEMVILDIKELINKN